ncbi:hypothetical protein A5777_17950 [Gordonia sp. 852002-10350_SCH5691597]|nr:hypothetical protein A5777_17950 [Gordonia sp. 852002-10350_SCH5691597]
MIAVRRLVGSRYRRTVFDDSVQHSLMIELAMFVERSAEVAWRALTVPDLIAQWLSHRRVHGVSADPRSPFARAEIGCG